MIVVELTGSGSLCVLARRMIRDGADRSEHVEWRRHGVPVFVKTSSLGWWADREVVESTNSKLPHIRLRRDFVPGSAEGSSEDG